MKEVIIVRGVPGSGKSTYVQTHFPQAIICSADLYHLDDYGNYNWKPQNVAKAHKYCKHTFLLALMNGDSQIVIDNTNTRHKEFMPYYTLAVEYGYNVSVIRLEAPLELLYGRNVHNVPDEVVKAMYDRMEPFEGETVVEQNY